MIAGQGLQDGRAHIRVCHHVVVERAVRFDIGQLQSLAQRHAFQRSHLVVQAGDDFLGAEAHAAAAEADQVGIGRMGADTDAVAGGQRQGPAQGHRVAAVKATGDVGLVDMGHHLFVQAHGPAAIALAEVAVQ